MGSTEEVRSRIDALIAQAQSAIPDKAVPPLPPSDDLRGEPAWHPFEFKIWELGEGIRQSLCERPRLRADPDLQDRFLAVAQDRKALRGRQAFVMLLGFKSCRRLASQLSRELDDPSVDGHVIHTLYKMRAPGFTPTVGPFQHHEKAWVRREARRYLEWDAQQALAADA